MCIFTVGGDFTGYYHSLRGLDGLSEIPTIFQEQANETLEFNSPAWLDDILIVTKGSVEHEKELIETLKETSLMLQPKKCEFFKNEAQWVGH